MCVKSYVRDPKPCVDVLHFGMANYLVVVVGVFRQRKGKE